MFELIGLMVFVTFFACLIKWKIQSLQDEAQYITVKVGK